MKRSERAFTVAKRIYTSDGFLCVDRIVRLKSGKFFLVEEPCEIGEREVSRPLSLPEVFAWYQIEPWQVERTVVIGRAGVSRA